MPGMVANFCNDPKKETGMAQKMTNHHAAAVVMTHQNVRVRFDSAKCGHMISSIAGANDIFHLVAGNAL